MLILLDHGTPPATRPTPREKEREERFLSAQDDPFTGAKGEEKVGLLRSERRGVESEQNLD